MKYLLGSFILLVFSCTPAQKKYSKEKLEENAYNLFLDKDYIGAIDSYNKLIKEDSLNGSYYYTRGYSFSMILKKDQAINDYLKSAQLNYKKGSCYYNIGLLHTFIQDSIALTYFKKALLVNPERDDIQQKYQECLKRLDSNSDQPY